MAVRLGADAAAAVSSGSAALELGLRALDVGPGAEVLIPTYVCDALHHAIVRCGARPVLVDADPTTLSLAADDAKRRLTAHARCAIVPHAFGLAIDLTTFAPLGIPLLEDCAQTLDAQVGGRPVGSLGHLAVCSFYATKLFTTGEGGLVAGPADLVAAVRDGRDYDERPELRPRFNYKLTDLQAALGRSQLERLGQFVERRRAIAARYRRWLAGLPCRLPPDVGMGHVYHRFVIVLDRPAAEVIERLRERGVAARRPVFRPLHHALGLDGFPEADQLWRHALSLPCYPALTDAEVDDVGGALAAVLRA
jgi:dTDP-4-amino-4,6-dideoxygalactose transaminase